MSPNRSTVPQARPLWPGSGPSEHAVRRRLRRELGHEPSKAEVARTTIALSTLGAPHLVQLMQRAEGRPKP
jgi:hypothetical protein